MVLSKKAWLIIISALIIMLGIVYWQIETFVPEPLDIEYSEEKVNIFEDVFTENNACFTDNDCILINSEIECPYCDRPQSLCETIDYSQDNYIAVNQKQIATWRTYNCEPKLICLDKLGPLPDNCSPNIVNSHVKAKCVNNTCQKTN